MQGIYKIVKHTNMNAYPIMNNYDYVNDLELKYCFKLRLNEGMEGEVVMDCGSEFHSDSVDG